MKIISVIITIEIVEGISSSPHYSVEFIEVEHSISISVSFFKHFLEFVIWNFLSDLSCDSFQIFEGDFVEVILIEEFEDFKDFLFGISGSLNKREVTMRTVMTFKN